MTFIKRRLSDACKKDDIEILDYIISNQYIDINSPIVDEKYPMLSLAAANDSMNVAEYLLSKGANINNLCDDRYPLYYSIRNHKTNMTKFLIDNGANVNIANSRGITPVMTSVGVHNPKTEILNYLINNNADVNMRANDGNTALMVAVYKYITRDEESLFEIIKMLLDNGATLNDETNKGHFNLFKICFRNHLTEILKLVPLYGGKYDKVYQM